MRVYFELDGKEGWIKDNRIEPGLEFTNQKFDIYGEKFPFPLVFENSSIIAGKITVNVDVNLSYPPSEYNVVIQLLDTDGKEKAEYTTIFSDEPFATYNLKVFIETDKDVLWDSEKDYIMTEKEVTINETYYQITENIQLADNRDAFSNS